MQKKNLLYILIVLLLFHGQVNNVQAQERLACATPKPTGAARIVPPGYYQRDISGMRMIKLFIYVTRPDWEHGSLAQTEEEILAHFEVVRQQFAPHGICFIIAGMEEIISTDMAFIDAESSEDSAMLGSWANSRPDCLSVFVHHSIEGNIAGSAWNIPNNFVSVEGGYTYGGFPVMASHEIGHALGLLHTFEDYYGEELVLRSGGCSNCSTTGDLVCDTEADKDILSQYFSNCAYIGNLKDACNNTYIMEPDNVMSYNALVSCLGLYGFTAGQAARMHYTIDNTPILQNVLLNTTSLTIITNQNYNSGSYHFTARNSISLNASSYIVSGTTGFQMSSAEITINPGATLSTSGGSGLVVLRANTMCQ